MNEITIVYKAPGQSHEIRKIPNTLKAMQELVGGYVEHLLLNNGLDLWFNEEGKLTNLEPNIMIPGGEVIVGSLFVSSSDTRGELIGLDEFEIVTVLSILKSWSLGVNTKR